MKQFQIVKRERELNKKRKAKAYSRRERVGKKEELKLKEKSDFLLWPHTFNI